MATAQRLSERVQYGLPPRGGGLALPAHRAGFWGTSMRSAVPLVSFIHRGGLGGGFIHNRPGGVRVLPLLRRR